MVLCIRSTRIVGRQLSCWPCAQMLRTTPARDCCRWRPSDHGSASHASSLVQAWIERALGDFHHLLGRCSVISSTQPLRILAIEPIIRHIYFELEQPQVTQQCLKRERRWCPVPVTFAVLLMPGGAFCAQVRSLRCHSVPRRRMCQA